MNKVFVTVTVWMAGPSKTTTTTKNLFVVVFVFVCLFVSYIMMESVCDTLIMS